jgi:hypothetical protein
MKKEGCLMAQKKGIGADNSLLDFIAVLLYIILAFTLFGLGL